MHRPPDDRPTGPDLPAGGGEMGERMRRFDWSTTSLGPLEGWPQSLRTAVSACLHCRFPMLLMWGPDLLQLYNDEYIPILGSKHPALGQPGREVWAEIWDSIGPMLLEAYHKGEATRARDLPLHLARGPAGEIEECWFSFSYSPLLDESGGIGGIFCPVIETTASVLSKRRLSEEKGRLNELFERAPSFMAVLRGPDHVIELANAAYQRIVGQRPLIGIPIRQALPELEGQGFFELLDTVSRTGEAAIVRRMPALLRAAPDEEPTERFVDFVYQPMQTPSGGVGGIFVEGIDITHSVRIERRQACLVELVDRVRDLRDAGEIASVAAELLGRSLGASRAGYAAAGPPGTDWVDVERDWTNGFVASIVGRHYVATYSARFVETLLRREVYAVDDIESDTTSADGVDAFRRIGTRAVITIPLAEDQRVAGVIFIHDAQPRRWSADDIRLVTDVADRTWASIRRAQAQAALREMNRTLEEQVQARTSELQRTMEALRQSQKMEALGQLTGGIAHDFNNLLQGIVASIEVAQRLGEAGRGDEAPRHLQIAMNAAHRAASLTHRLLAFARRQPLAPRPVRLNPLLGSMEELLRRTLGGKVELEFIMAGQLWPTLCDPHQLENAILNLAINGRDAMPEGGRLTLETCNTHLDEAYAAREGDVAPGQYVALAVSDTGVGMSADVISRAFDPFFTTKPLGQGTGLGLSMIHGFVHQSHGHVRIYSEIGRGTTVKLFLPRHHGPVEAVETKTPLPAPVQDAPMRRTILVVEDEAVVLELVVAVLREAGHNVLQATDGHAALALLKERHSIDLLVTDVGLPGIDGQQLVDLAHADRPDLRVLIMTGYAANAAIAGGFVKPGTSMLSKPFGIDALLERVEQLLRT